MERVYCVYLLASGRNGTLYCGVTNDLVRRVWEHKENPNPRSFAAKHGVTLLVWYERHSSVGYAIQREKNIKKWPRKWKLDLIEKSNPDWRDLYDDIVHWGG